MSKISVYFEKKNWIFVSKATQLNRKLSQYFRMLLSNQNNIKIIFLFFEGSYNNVERTELSLLVVLVNFWQAKVLDNESRN